MARCWELRGGCDDEMRAACPHATVGERCPARCAFAECDRPTHVITTDPGLIFTIDIDRNVALKESCLSCEHFLTRGPRPE